MSRWGVLRKKIPMNITITNICSLVRCIFILHNFCINESLDKDDIEIITEDTANIIPPTNTVLPPERIIYVSSKYFFPSYYHFP